MVTITTMGRYSKNNSEYTVANELSDLMVITIPVGQAEEIPP